MESFKPSYLLMECGLARVLDEEEEEEEDDDYDDEGEKEVDPRLKLASKAVVGSAFSVGKRKLPMELTELKSILSAKRTTRLVRAKH